jgi:hypothetical protein
MKNLVNERKICGGVWACGIAVHKGKVNINEHR